MLRSELRPRECDAFHAAVKRDGVAVRHAADEIEHAHEPQIRPVVFCCEDALGGGEPEPGAQGAGDGEGIDALEGFGGDCRKNPAAAARCVTWTVRSNDCR